MKTSQKFSPSLLFAILFMLVSCYMVYPQQGEIVNILSGNIPIDGAKIILTAPKGKPQEINAKKRTSSQSGTKIEDGSILEVPSNITIVIKSANNNEATIKGHEVILFNVSNKSENYRKLDEDNEGSLLIKIGKKLDKFGNEIAGAITETTSANGSFNAAADFTEWILSSDGSELDFEIKEGQISINSRSKIEIKDDVIETQDSLNRVLYVDETLGHVNLKIPNFKVNPSEIPTKTLTSDKEIDNFFNSEFKKQKQNLKRNGLNSLSGFKALEQGFSSEGISNYEKAIEEGEIGVDKFIQGSLILVEAYFEKNALNERAVWLDAALHFIKKTEAANREKYDHFKELGFESAMKAFGHDLALSNDYFAWAFTVKLKLNNCLESADENPLKFIDEAFKIRKEIKQE